MSVRKPGEIGRPVHTVRIVATVAFTTLLSLISACGSGGGGDANSGGAVRYGGGAGSATGSSKFIPTFLVYYGGGPTLTSADIPKLAKYDLLDVDRFRYNNVGSNTWAAIKAINPNVQIYLYQMGPESPSHLDNYQQMFLNGIGRHDVARGHPMGSINGNNSGLYQKDAAGNRIYSQGYSNPGANQYWYLMDFGSAAYQSYWISATKADIADQPWAADGIFVDNCVNSAAAGGYNATSAWYSTNAAWSTAMNSFSSAITAGMRAHGQKIWCNKGDTRSAEGNASWRELDNSANSPDILLEEGAFAVEWGADTQFYPEADWKRQVDNMGAIKKAKIALMSHTKLSEGQSGTDNWGRPVTFWQTLSYALGSFLLGKNDTLGNSYFMFNGGSGYNKIWWFDEYDKLDMGKALGPYTVQTIGGVNIYSREFEKGYVYVNPTNSPVSSISLPQASRQITHDNLNSALSSLPSVSTISLNAHNAAFLMKTSATLSANKVAPDLRTLLAAARAPAARRTSAFSKDAGTTPLLSCGALLAAAPRIPPAQLATLSVANPCA